MKKVFSSFLLVLIVGFSLISITGCGNAGGTNSDDILTPYNFANRSSYTVTLRDSTASKTLEPGYQIKIWFNSVHPVSDLRYAPADKVKLVGSGLFYDFVDK
ncbi:MAG: hypothetical protein ACTTKH_03450 [Treponema sp.]